MRKMKSSKKDYTADDLPQTRKDVFFDCFKEHLSVLFRLGFLCFLFFIPIIILMLMYDGYVVNSIDALPEQTPEAISEVYYSANAVYGLVQVFAFALFFLLFSGVVQILRQLAWNEPLFFGDDFKRGLKSNALRFALSAFFLAGTSYMIKLNSGEVTYYVFNAIYIIVLLPIILWEMTQGVYYKVRTLESIKNALFCYLKTVPVTLLIVVLSAVPFWAVINFVPNFTVKYVVLLVLAAFYIVPLCLAWLLYACHIFDENINKENYPSIYRKGMRKETCKKDGNDNS